MKKAYHPKIRFYIGKADGHFTNNGWINKHYLVFNKKTDALTIANQIFQSQGQVYIKVTYRRKLYNDGIYSTKKDLEEAMSVFTEMPLINYALEGK